jgi:inorganic pyrophosphatase
MIKVLIEVAAGSCDKNLYHARTLEYQGTRQVSRSYPYPYGFIVGTRTADGDGVDCYLITQQVLEPGTIVECEPVGLLEHDEDGEVDHKVLAALPGQAVDPGQDLLHELRDFIYAIFAQLPEAHVRVGRILPREAALRHIRDFQDACQSPPSVGGPPSQ